jgi:hypothetical protein
VYVCARLAAASLSRGPSTLRIEDPPFGVRVLCVPGSRVAFSSEPSTLRIEGPPFGVPDSVLDRPAAMPAVDAHLALQLLHTMPPSAR